MWSWSQRIADFFCDKTLRELWPPRRTAESDGRRSTAAGMKGTWEVERWMRVPSVARELRAAAARNVSFNPERVSRRLRVSNPQLSCLWSGFLPARDGFSSTMQPQQDRITRHTCFQGWLSSSPPSCNQVKWPCLYADLQLDTSVFTAIQSILLTPYCGADASKRRSVSITAKRGVGHLYVTRQTRHPSFSDR